MRFRVSKRALHVCAAVFMTSACGKDVLKSIPEITNEFTQNTAADVDILWVVDNSHSMNDEQVLLGRNFEVFIDNLRKSAVDYQVGVISTDPADGGLLHAPTGQPIIDQSTQDPLQTFTRNVKVGVSGAPAEKAFESVALALGKGLGWTPNDPVTLPNPGFPREDAGLFVIMVSDEDDKSFGPVTYYYRLIDSIKGPGNEAQVSVSVVVSLPNEPLCSNTSGDRPVFALEAGKRYAELATRTHGVKLSLCGDFAESLEALSITASGLKAVFPLSDSPNRGSSIDCGDLEPTFLCVRVNDQPVAGSNWRYDANANVVEFKSTLPPAQSTITITYRKL